jgi:hypothetical protein
MTAKDSRPQYTIGKENRFSKASMIQWRVINIFCNFFKKDN